MTGGAGFIGANFVKMLAEKACVARIVVLDALTYCGNIKSLSSELESGKIGFVKGNICNRELVQSLLEQYEPTYLINFAAETHVDRSLDDSRPFVQTNVEGTLNLLDCANRQRSAQIAQGITPTLVKYVQVSTDEVYGQLKIDCPNGTALPSDVETKLQRREPGIRYGTLTFNENTPLQPSSPYSASKASADLLVLAYFHSFGLPAVVTRCSNNYGPYQYPEKLIPLMINNILNRKPLPVYGRGLNVRDWIYVRDHARGVLAAAKKGVAGQVYNFGGYSERRNIDVVNALIEIVASSVANNKGIDSSLVQYVADRPGHDSRYAIDASKAMSELDWRPETSFSEGLSETVAWYLNNRKWLEDIVSGDYMSYYDKMYSNR